MGNKKIVSATSAVVLLAALGSLYLTIIGLPPRVDARPHEALGEAMAREALQQRGPDGRILLIRRDTALYPNPAAEAQIRAFLRAVSKAGASVTATTLVKSDPLRVVSVPSADFYALLGKGTESDVIVSFLGPPQLAPGQLAKLAAKRPKVVALCIGEIPRQADLKRQFNEKLVQAAILSRRDISSAPPLSDALHAWFDHFFVVATEANAAELLVGPERK